MAELPWEDPNWSQGDELTAQEWVNHVQEGHPEANSDFDVAINASGNYEITHTPSGNSFVLNQDGTLSAPALSAENEFTDPGGMTYTGTINPVQVTEEASTFAESDVTVTHNQTAVTNGSIELDVVVDGLFPDDFEDGVDSGWSGDTSYLSATTSTVLSGTQSGELSTDGSDPSVTSPSVGDSTTNLKYRKQVSEVPDGKAWVVIYNSSGDSIFFIKFGSSGEILLDGSTSNNTLQTFSAGTAYDIEVLWDFPNDQAEIVVNGTSHGSYSFRTSTSSWDYVTASYVAQDAQMAFYLDNKATSYTSGDALIEWDSGVPDDIESWDLATFQRTLDNETVTVDVGYPDPSTSIIDDFESGDLTVENFNWNDWAGNTGTLSAQQTTVLAGSWSAQLDSSNSTQFVYSQRSSDVELPELTTVLQIASDTGNSSDAVRVSAETSSGTSIATIQFEDSTKSITVNGNDTGSAWSTGTTYSVAITNIDYGSETFDVALDGATIASDVGFQSSVSGCGRFEIANGTVYSGASRTAYFDDVETVEESFNAVYTDITQNFDISTIDTTENVKLRANLQRDNTDNNPTLDYAARRFTR